MRAIGEAGYILSKSEICTLAGMAGCKELIGIEMNRPVEEDEIVRDLEKAKSGLAEKKYLQKVDGGYGVDRNISYLIKACCNPLNIVRLIKCKEGSRSYRYYYFNSSVIVELDQDMLREDIFILTPMSSAGKAIDNMEEFFHIGQISGRLESRIFDNKFSIDHDILKRMMDRDTAQSGIQNGNALSEAGLEDNLAEDLLYALNDSGESYSMLLIKLDDTKTFHRCDIYAGKQFLWKVTGNQEQRGNDIVSPGSREDISIATQQLIDIIKNSVY